jgi:alginate production protein
MRLLASISTLALALVAMPAHGQDDERRAPEGALEIARELGLSDDERRPEDQLQFEVFGRPLVIGGEIETELQLRENYDLGTEDEGDDIQLAAEIKLEAVLMLDDDLVTYTEVKAGGEHDLHRQGGGASGEGEVQLSEAWVLKTGLLGTPLALQVGRQQLQDRREWWWDEDLDMVRLHYFGRDVHGFVGVGRELGHYSTLGARQPDERDIIRTVASVSWDWMDRQELHLYFLDQHDASPFEAIGARIGEDAIDDVDGDLTWLGMRVRGRVKADFPGKFYYWADLALLTGHEDELELDELANGDAIVTGHVRNRARGWAFDVGASLELPFAFEPYLTLAYARGSGGDETFRQTGLHGNNGKLRGNARFRYYGEVLRPELSNLAIATIALGIPIGEDGWIETVWHDYRQVSLEDSLAGSRLDLDPEGLRRGIGQELDIVASYRPPSGWDFELTGGVFRAGPAFGTAEGEQAWQVRANVTRNF